MKRLLFLFLLYTVTITSNIRTAADALANCCLSCGEEDNIISLCSTNKDHTLSCKKHCPELFDLKACTECMKPLTAKLSLPKDFVDEIDAKAHEIEILAIEKQIKENRLRPIKNHHTALVDSIIGTFGCIVLKKNQRTVNQTQEAITKREKLHRAWDLVVSTFAYHRAWQAMIKDPEDPKIHIKLQQIICGLPTYEDQATVHLVGHNTQRFQLVYAGTKNALKHTEGHDLDIAPDLSSIALQDMSIAETTV